ncbi:hypothetical protein [Streptacidiphilus sp. PAMC 29251]
MKLRISIGTAVAAAASVLALTAGSAVAATPVAHTAVTASTKAAARVATHLTLKTSTANAKAGTWITLTAHLDKHGTNRTVVVYGQAWGKGDKPFVVGKGAVDKHGNLTIKYHSYQNHTFWATFSGGATYAASHSSQHIVRATAAVSAKLSGYYSSYTWAGHSVHKFHAKTAPVVRGTVSPSKAGQNFTMYVQVFYKGKWIAANTPVVFKLDSHSNYAVNFPNWEKGYVFRSAASFRGDARDHAGSAAWSYWTITA